MRRADPQASATDWRVGDRALVESARSDRLSFRATVVELIRIAEQDVGKLRLKYPWIRGGDIILVLRDENDRRHYRLAADLEVKRVIVS